VNATTEVEHTAPPSSRQAVDLALEAALVVLRNGGSTEAADRTFANILRGWKQSEAPTTWRLDFIATTGPESGQSATVIRPVGPIGVNLVRASEAEALGERVARGEVAAEAVSAEIARIGGLPSPYSRAVLVAAAGIAAACFSQLLGGDQGSLAVAAVAAGIGQFFRSLLQAGKLAVATVTLIVALVSACIAAVGLRLGFSQVAPATVIASVIYMVPGLPLINGFVDVVAHKYLLTGIERIANAAFLFLVLAVAIVLALTAIL
jgi:uncharacterized membrane protein YjjP (DUF1212 family)